MTETPKKYAYYEKDGAVFRGEPGRMAVQDVLRSGNVWEPYEGDRLAPCMFGNRLADDPED